jgi:hypothetical protein
VIDIGGASLGGGALGRSEALAAAGSAAGGADEGEAWGAGGAAAAGGAVEVVAAGARSATGPWEDFEEGGDDDERAGAFCDEGEMEAREEGP